MEFFLKTKFVLLLQLCSNLSDVPSSIFSKCFDLKLYSLTIKIYVLTSLLELVIQENLNLCPQTMLSCLAQNKQSCIPIEVRAMHRFNTSKCDTTLEQIVKAKRVTDTLYVLHSR